MEDIVLESAKQIIGIYVIGPVCVVLGTLVVIRERYWQTEMKTERGAHDKTREALLAEVRSNGETIALVRQQMQGQQSAFETLMKLVRREAA